MAYFAHNLILFAYLKFVGAGVCFLPRWRAASERKRQKERERKAEKGKEVIEMPDSVAVTGQIVSPLHLVSVLLRAK